MSDKSLDNKSILRNILSETTEELIQFNCENDLLLNTIESNLSLSKDVVKSETEDNIKSKDNINNDLNPDKDKPNDKLIYSLRRSVRNIEKIKKRRESEKLDETEKFGVKLIKNKNHSSIDILIDFNKKLNLFNIKKTEIVCIVCEPDINYLLLNNLRNNCLNDKQIENNGIKKLRKFKCIYKYCNQIFNSYNELKVHVIEYHNNTKLFECKFNDCQKIFSRNDKLKEHMKRHLGLKNFKCGRNDCESSFVSLHHLKQHIRQVHKIEDNIDEYVVKTEGQSQQMDFNINDQNNYNMETEIHTQLKPIEIVVSENNYLEIDTKNRTLRPVMAKETYSCELKNCCQIFYSKSHLSRHIFIDHKKRFKCNYNNKCNKIFERKDRLKEHMKRHLGLKTFKCAQISCNLSFVTFSECKKHVIKNHAISEDVETYIIRNSDQSIAQSINNYSFESSEHSVNENLNQTHNNHENDKQTNNSHENDSHIRNHSHIDEAIDRLQPIDIGDYFTKRDMDIESDDQNDISTELQTDELIMNKKKRNSDPNRYKCQFEDCLSGYSNKTDLKEHLMSYHQNQKPFKCTYDDCDVRFGGRQPLKRHIDCVHKKLKPFICDVKGCEKAFARKDKLKSHMRSHSKLNPYSINDK